MHGADGRLYHPLMTKSVEYAFEKKPEGKKRTEAARAAPRKPLK